MILTLAGTIWGHAQHALLEDPGALPGAEWVALWDSASFPLLFAPLAAIVFVLPGRQPARQAPAGDRRARDARLFGMLVDVFAAACAGRVRFGRATGIERLRLIKRRLVYGVLTLLRAGSYAAIALGRGVAVGGSSASTTAAARRT